MLQQVSVAGTTGDILSRYLRANVA